MGARTKAGAYSSPGLETARRSETAVPPSAQPDITFENRISSEPETLFLSALPDPFCKESQWVQT
jgi:hypothetical protein